MGQKVHPIAFRLGVSVSSVRWLSSWYASKKKYTEFLKEDFKIRTFLDSRLKSAVVSSVKIERSHKNCVITIHCARPALVIGKKGAGIAKLKKELSIFSDSDIHINLTEVERPEINAMCLCKKLSDHLMRRGSFRSIANRVIQEAMRWGIYGIRIMCSGRLGGVDIARSERFEEGRMSLHTLRNDIDYAQMDVLTTYGELGVKIWIFNNPESRKRSVRSGPKRTKKSDFQGNAPRDDRARLGA